MPFLEFILPKFLYKINKFAKLKYQMIKKTDSKLAADS